MTEQIKELIVANKPNISKSSITTYLSILKNLHIKVFGDNIDVSNFKKADKILKFLEELEPAKRKTVLSALVVITDNKKYRDQMLKDIEEYKSNESTQKKNDKQSESWVDTETIDDIFNKLESNAKLIYKKKSYTSSDLQEIQLFIILCVLSGKFIPPRRSKDYVDFKIKDIDPEVDNYLHKKTMVFNSYKTAKTYQRQELPVPPELMKILNKWIKINPTEYLFFDSNLKKLSNVKLTQRLNKIFGKKASVNQMRHTYLSSKYQKTIELNKEMEADMAKMGTSKAQEKIYIKKD
jgi:integrase